MDWKAFRRKAHILALTLQGPARAGERARANPQHAKGHKARKKRKRQNRKAGRR